MLKKTILILIIFFSFNFSVSADTIDDYQINIFLNKDGSLDVEENINYNFEDNGKHGIYRFIPKHFKVKGQEKGKGLKKRKLEFSDLKVYRNEVNILANKIIKNDNDNFFIKMGNPNLFYSGVHKYTIQYKVKGALKYFKDFDEIYGNAVGFNWGSPIKHVKVNLKANINNFKFQNISCFQGNVNSEENCEIYQINEKEIYFETTRRLKHHEGLVISASFSKGAVKKVELGDGNIKNLNVIFIGFVIALIISTVVLIDKYLNRFNLNKFIIPIYKPYKKYHPALTGYLIDKKLDPRDITAGILSLAQKGIIEIRRVEKKGVLFGKNIDYIFKLKKDVKDIKDELDKMFVRLIFSKQYNFEIFLGDLSPTAQRFLINDIQNIYSEINLSRLEERTKNIYSQKENIEEWLKKYLLEKGFFETRLSPFVILILILGFILIFYLLITKTLIQPFGVSFIEIFLFTIVPVSWGLLLRYTKKGGKAKNSLDGFKLFLEMTEKERLTLIKAPQLNSKYFFEYLPYAIAFGVEKKGEEQFQMENLSKPDGYMTNEVRSVNFIVKDIPGILNSITKSTSTTSVSASMLGAEALMTAGKGLGGGGGGAW